MDTNIPQSAIVNFGVLLSDVSRLARARFDQRARSVGVTRSQWRVLFQLHRFPGLTQSALADNLEVERITIGRIIDRLVEAGLVERRGDPEDRRVWRVHLLPAAHKFIDKLNVIASELEAELMSRIQPEVQQIVMSTLISLRDDLRRDVCGKASA
jgi:DNA-binding MarR family transcriptional regulator